MAKDNADDLFESGEDVTELFEAGEDVEAPRSLMQKVSDYIPSRETLSDFGNATKQGVSFGFSDEIAAKIQSMAGATPEEKEAIYNEVIAEERAKIAQAEERSPYASMAGEITGAILPAIATGGTSLYGTLGKQGLKEALKQGGKKQLLKAIAGKAALGGVEGATAGALTGAGKAESNKDRLSGAYEGGKSGAMFGTGAGLIAPAAELTGMAGKKILDKADEFVEKTPYLRQMKTVFDEAKGGAPRSTSDIGVAAMAKESQEGISGLTNRVLQADQQFGQKIGSLIDDASNKGVTLKIDEAMDEASTKLQSILAKDPDIIGEREFQRLAQEILDLKSSKLTPVAAKRLRDNVNALADKLQDIPHLRNVAQEFQGSLKNLMEAQVPGLKEASAQFKQFREAVPETILGKGKLTEFSDNWFGSLKNKEEKLSESVRSLLETVSSPGESRKIAQTTINQLTEQLKAKPEMLKAMGFDSIEDFIKNIRKAGDKEAIAQAMLGYEPRIGLGKELKSLALGGLGTTAKGLSLGASNVAGQAVGGVQKIASKVTQPVANMSRKIYRASDDVLRNFASKVQQTPGLEGAGNVLMKALDNKSSVAKNAALFSLLQKPEARNVMKDFDFGFDTEED